MSILISNGQIKDEVRKSGQSLKCRETIYKHFIDYFNWMYPISIYPFIHLYPFIHFAGIPAKFDTAPSSGSKRTSLYRAQGI